MSNRAHARVHVGQSIECIVAGERHFADLYDLSVGGCMLELSGSVSVGDDISVNIFDLDKVRGHVVWSHERNAGVQFEHEIHPAIVAHLGFVSSPLSFAEIAPRDRFGRRLPQSQSEYHQLRSLP